MQFCQQRFAAIAADFSMKFEIRYIFLAPPQPPINLLQKLASEQALMQIKYSGNCTALHNRGEQN